MLYANGCEITSFRKINMQNILAFKDKKNVSHIYMKNYKLYIVELYD